MFRSYLEILMRHQPKFGRASALYAFTTENLSGHFPLLGLQRRSVLAVCGSGDHLLNAILYGANPVAGFDLNFVALLWTELKLAAIRLLPFEAFQEFFFRESLTGAGLNAGALDYGTFCGLKEQLKPETAKFFDKLFAAFDNDGYALRSSALFNNRYDFNVVKRSSNPYLSSPDRYDELRERLKEAKLRLISASVLDIAEKERGQLHDVIILSNLCDYAPGMFAPGEDSYRSYFSCLCTGLLEVLSPDGEICALYLYGQPPDLPPHSDLDIAEKREAILRESGFDYREHNFAGVKPDSVDSVVVLTRKQYDSSLG